MATTMTTDKAPCFVTTIDQHQFDHEATGLPMMQYTDVRTDFADYFPDIDWDEVSEADRETYRDELTDIHAAVVELESLRVDERDAAKEHLSQEGASDPWSAADAIRRAIKNR